MRVTIMKKNWEYPQTFRCSELEAAKLKREEAESYRDCLTLTLMSIEDWFTLAPQYRTKENLLERVRASLGGVR